VFPSVQQWYAVSGCGQTAEGLARREQIRFQAAELFAAGIAPREVARRLRVTRQISDRQAFTVIGRS
jgi:hypothetical protein